MVSLLHDLTGYGVPATRSPEHRLDAGGPGLGLSVRAAVRGGPGGLAALVVLGTFSLLAHNATGAGMEMLNLTMLLLTLASRRPLAGGPRRGACRRAGAVLVVLLAQTRYERRSMSRRSPCGA